MTVEALSFELAANHLRDAVFVLDPSGKILWANQAAAAAAGRNAESLVNLRLTEILTPRSSEIAEPVLGSERPPGGAPALIELDILRPDLSSRRLEVSLSRLAGNNSQTLVAIARDVSERHLLDEERRRADFQTLQFQVALLELGQSQSSNLEEFLTHVTALSAATLDVARVSVWVYSETYSEIRCAHLFDREQGLHESGAALEVERYPRHFGALRDFRTIAACDARNDPLTAELTDYLAARGTVSVLDVPIRREGKPIGVLCHEHTGQPRRWKLDEQNFAASLADLTALALETNRRRLAENELRESLDNLELFFSQSLDGFFFMMLDEPVRWGDNVNQEPDPRLRFRAPTHHQDQWCHARAIRRRRASSSSDGRRAISSLTIWLMEESSGAVCSTPAGCTWKATSAGSTAAVCGSKATTSVSTTPKGESPGTSASSATSRSANRLKRRC